MSLILKMAGTRKYYKSDKITISFDPKLCIHAGECVRGIPEVFDVRKRPWINPSGADIEKIVDVIERCPSGALQYELRDGGKEPVAGETTITVVPRGPLYVHGNIVIEDKAGNILYKGTRAALCRCGQSRNMPFCDETHRKIKFESK